MILQHWSGIITSIDLNAGHLSALIEDKTESRYPDELICININNFSEEEIPFLNVGSIFDWIITEEIESTISSFKLSKMNRKEFSIYKKRLVKIKKTSKILSKKFIDNKLDI